MDPAMMSVTLKDGGGNRQQAIDFSNSATVDLKLQNISLALMKVVKDIHTPPQINMQVNGKMVFLYGGCETMPPTEASIPMASQITFQVHEVFLKIIFKNLVGDNDETVWWTDPNWVDTNPEHANEIYVWKYKPCLLPLEDIKVKCRQFQIDFPEFKINIAYYNRHGIVTWGWDKSSKIYGIFYGNPLDSKLRKLSDEHLGEKDVMEDCGELAEVSFNRSEVFAVSKNRFFTLLSSPKYDCLLNYEPGKKLRFNDL